MGSLQYITTAYQKRMHKVFQFIDTHLTEDLTLDKVAEVAMYSPYHFHRIFKEITGEPLSTFIARIRLEKAALVLMRKQTVVVTELATEFGFNSNTAFTRAFKKRYGMSPTQFRRELPEQYSKIGIIDSKNGKVENLFAPYFWSITNLQNWITMNATIAVTKMPKMNIACVTVIGHLQVAQGFARVMQWATPKGLLHENTTMITVYHDSFKTTHPDKVRMSTGMLVADEVQADEVVGKLTLTPGKCIQGTFEISLPEFEKAWVSMFIWMQEQGFTKANTHPFELIHTDYREHPEQKCKVTMYIPVE